MVINVGRERARDRDLKLKKAKAKDEENKVWLRFLNNKARREKISEYANF
jgi:hypothetical protein